MMVTIITEIKSLKIILVIVITIGPEFGPNLCIQQKKFRLPSHIFEKKLFNAKNPMKLGNLMVWHFALPLLNPLRSGLSIDPASGGLSDFWDLQLHWKV